MEPEYKEGQEVLVSNSVFPNSWIQRTYAFKGERGHFCYTEMDRNFARLYLLIKPLPTEDSFGQESI